MLDRFLNRSPDPNDIDPGLFDDVPLPLLDNALASLDVKTLTEMLENALVEDVDSMASEEQVWATILACQLELSGQPGHEALWQIVERANPGQLRIVLYPLLISHKQQTRTRRFLYSQLDEEHPERIVAGISGFQMRRDRKARGRVLTLKDHDAPIVRAAVLSYYRTVFEAECLQAVLGAAADPAPEVRRAVGTCLVDLGIVAASPEVRQALGRVRGREAKYAAGEVLNGLGYAGDDLAVATQEAQEFHASLGGETSWEDVEQEERELPWGPPLHAYIALAIGDPDNARLKQSVGELWESDDDEDRYVAILTMAALNDRTRETEILALREPYDESLSGAAYAYQRIFDPRGAVPDLLKLLKQRNLDAQLTAIATLSSIYAAEVDDRVREVLEQLTQDADETVRRFARVSLQSEWERRYTYIDMPGPGPLWSAAAPLESTAETLMHQGR